MLVNYARNKTRMPLTDQTNVETVLTMAKQNVKRINGTKMVVNGTKSEKNLKVGLVDTLKNKNLHSDSGKNCSNNENNVPQENSHTARQFRARNNKQTESQKGISHNLLESHRTFSRSKNEVFKNNLIVMLDKIAEHSTKDNSDGNNTKEQRTIHCDNLLESHSTLLQSKNETFKKKLVVMLDSISEHSITDNNTKKTPTIQFDKELKGGLQHLVFPATQEVNSYKPHTLRVQNPKKYTDAVPIYLKKLPDEPRIKNKTEDLYEFTETSPKKVEQWHKVRRSSIPFEKATHDILKRLEAKENKEKRRIIRRRNKKPVKSYKNIVKGIMNGVMTKIHEKSAAKVTNSDKVIKINNFMQEIKLNATANSVNCDNVTKTKENVAEHKENNLATATQKPKSWPEFLENISFCNNDNDNYEGFDEPQLDCEEDNEESINNYFGFDEEPVNSNKINIISDILLPNSSTPENNQHITRRRPNPNTLSPWRVNWVTTRPNFVSVKSNALPRIQQEMVVDHSLVETLEQSATKTTMKTSPVKKQPVQQSILEFIETTIEKEPTMIDRSLYDYEEFNVSVKNTPNKVKSVKRAFGSIENIISSTPVQRTVLQDITNSSGSNENTLFGFNTSVNLPSPHQDENKENNPTPKPSRFDPNILRSYKPNNKKAVTFDTIALDKSVSIMDDDSYIADSGDFKLFDDPEDILNAEDATPAPSKKRRRKRLNSSNSDVSDTERKQKKHKKTKLEIEQDRWIEQFNKECDAVDNHQLDVE